MSALRFRAPCMAGAAALLALFYAGAAGAATPSATLTGVVIAQDSPPVVIVVLDDRNRRIVHRLFLERPGRFKLPLDPGRYRLYAFADADRDGARVNGDASSPVFVLASALRAGDRLELPALALAR